MPRISKTARFYWFITLMTFLAGLSPVIFNLIVDPYEINDLVAMDMDKAKISEKAHYPLWKVAHYPAETSDVIILGDSRARALRDKYWHELGLTGAYNFAYGGATIYEIYDTFLYVKDNPNLKTLVVGIQLRSFDPDHKAGLNRVPEAIRLYENPLQYNANWFVSRIGMKNLKHHYPDHFKKMAALKPSLISSAMAEDVTGSGHDLITELLDPEVCANCLLPTDIKPTLHPGLIVRDPYHFSHGLGVWAPLWAYDTIDRDLPKKFARQVRKNAASDWQAFDFSDDLWDKLAEMSHWAAQNDVELIFVIPPTIVEMQGRIAEFGFGELNHDFRKRLLMLGTVVDFDFDSTLTRNLERFTDAYHFDYKASKMIVGEIALMISDDAEVIRTAQKRRKDVICPIRPQDISQRLSDGRTEVLEGRSCRIWQLDHKETSHE